jgi:predicted amidophosphoribosyltransferase
MGPVTCPECAAPVLPPARTCPRCGHPQAAAPPNEAERREIRAGAVAAKIVAVLVVVYMLGVAGYFVYDHLL